MRSTGVFRWMVAPRSVSCRRQRVEEGLKAAFEDAEPQAARVDARPHPRHVDAVVLLAELADQQRAEELVVARRPHVAQEPLVRRDVFQRLPERRQLEERARQQKARLRQQRHRQRQRRDRRDLRADDLAVDPIARFRAREDDFVADAHFLRQREDRIVGLEPVVVELLQPPVPAIVFEPARQPAHAGLGFVERDLVPGADQIPRRRHAGRACSDDGDFHNAATSFSADGVALSSLVTLSSAASCSSRST